MVCKFYLNEIVLYVYKKDNECFPFLRGSGGDNHLDLELKAEIRAGDIYLEI